MRKFQAPGRVNLIGEHTDYNGGFVLPAAIEFRTTVTLEPSAVGFEALSHDLPGQLAIRPGEPIVPTGQWFDYVLGVAVELERLGVPLPQAKLTFASNIPMGAGLSSSAALLVSAALAMLAHGGQELEPMEIARVCQMAEVNFVGTRCGIMDQFISVHGMAESAVLLDCRSLEFRPVPVPGELSLVIANTMVKHAHAGGEYNQRRLECEQAARALGVGSLRDARLDQIGALSPLEQKRVRHIVTENSRVLAFVEALAADDHGRAGDLMAASHTSLRDDFEVSCYELDVMVELAQPLPGLVGARMTGGGFGGCTINLVQTDLAAEFATKLAAHYHQAVGIVPDIHISRAAQGAGEVLGG